MPAKKSLHILDVTSVSINPEIYNLTAINRGRLDPYFVEFIEPFLNDIGIDVKILPYDQIDKNKKWFVNVDINSWKWVPHDGDAFASFGSDILHEFQHGKAYLILNHQCESWTESTYRELYKKLTEYPSIPFSKIIYMVGAADAKQEYERFVNKYSISKENRIRVMYTHHVYKRFEKDCDLRFFDFNRNVKKEKKFLSLNRRWRDHRLMFVSCLAYNDLIKHGYVSLGVDKNEVESAQNQLDNFFRTKLDVYGIKAGFASIKNQLPLKTDDIDLTINQFQLTALPIEFYQKSCFSVVSSTMAFNDHEKSVGFTEKEVKPILAKHPFIIHNMPGVLKHMKAMGFLTFEPWFDESYDTETNDLKRLKMIVDEIKRLSEISFEDWEKMLDEMQPVLDHNYNRMVKYTNEHCFYNSDLKELLYYVD